MATQDKQTIEDYIRHKRQSGMSDQDIAEHLVRAGWNQQDVSNLLSDDVPPPPAPLPNNEYSQTGNTGRPLQVENVAYNMKMKPVESKIGIYIRLTMLGLWATVIAVCSLLSTVVQASDESSDVGAVLVFVISACVISVPIFWIANKKLRAALAADPRLVEDLFFKKKVRGHLMFAVVATAIAGFFAIFQLLSLLFLESADANFADSMSALVFALGFGAILAFLWQLHAQTKR